MGSYQDMEVKYISKETYRVGGIMTEMSLSDAIHACFWTGMCVLEQVCVFWDRYHMHVRLRITGVCIGTGVCVGVPS